MRKRQFHSTLLSLIIFAPLASAEWSYEVLHEFERPGTQPMSALILHPDGNYYGTTVEGGTHGHGTVFRATPAGSISTLVSFSGVSGNAPGIASIAALEVGADGALYGTTSGGGAGGFGVAFKVTTGGAYTKLVDFTGAAGVAKGSVPGDLLLHSNGLFYGTTQAGGAQGFGTVFSLTSDGTLTTVLEFTGTAGVVPGSMPIGRMAVSGNSLFGVTQAGGASNLGTVYHLTTAGVWSGMTEFNDANGSRPGGGVVLHSDGALYGSAEFGGANGFGTAFKLTTGASPQFTLLRSFDDPSGSQPVGRLEEGADHALYGATSAGGFDGWGALFRLSPNGDYSVIAEFTGEFGVTAGSTPRSGPRLGSGGNLFGTTSAGGPGNLGVIYRITLAGSYTRLANFSVPLGWAPSGAPVSDGEGGVLFPMAEGGDGGVGTIVRWSAATDVELAGALGGGLGSAPDGSLAPIGQEFFGVTSSGGSSNRGTAYKYDVTNGPTLLANFTSSLGSVSEGPLVQGADGALYGVSREGGTSARGTVYRLSLAGMRTRLASFSGFAGSHPGRRPRGGLALAANGDFYGATELGGSANQGVVYRISSTGVYQPIHEFVSPGPNIPEGGMVAGADGMIYGAASLGGGADAGAIFRVDPSTDQLSTVAEFVDGAGASAGKEPVGEISVDEDGTVWGVLRDGGPFNAGAVYSYSPQSGLETVISLSGTSGDTPGVASRVAETGLLTTGGLRPQQDGSVLGVVPSGGAGGGGVIFRLRPPSPLEEWKVATLGSADAPDLGDPDGDGFVNLIEYVLGITPVVADSSGVLNQAIRSYAEGDRLSVLVPRNPERWDVTVVVESSDDLRDPWTVLATSSNGEPFVGAGYVGGDSNTPGLKSVEIRDLVNVSGNSTRFIRIRATH